MAGVTVSSKGQITLPARMRRDAGIALGAKVNLTIHGKTLIIDTAPDFFSLKGCLGKAKPHEEERAAAEMEAARFAWAIENKRSLCLKYQDF